MATRSQIIVKNKDTKGYVYHHNDGYPEGVGKEVREFLHEHSGITDVNEFCKELEKWDFTYEFENSGLHGDEEYVYLVDLAKHRYVCYNTQKNVNGFHWFDIPEEEVFNCKTEFDEVFF